MNMQDYKRYTIFSFFCIVTILLTLGACKKEKQYVYDVNGVTVTPEGAGKNTPKTMVEFISITYADLFGQTIGNDELTKLSFAYSAFGDKKLVERMIIKNYLNNPSANIPNKANMQANTDVFITNTYKKFYNRNPNEFELWAVKNSITADTNISPEVIYYSVMTSNEYRYY